jgi:NifU-like protein involved in Fe-S cluster formation
MTITRPAKLYSPALLGLATELANFPFDSSLPIRAEARSRSCGSVITVGLALGPLQDIARIGMQVSACAIGQASAALLAQNAVGTKGERIEQTTSALQDWLSGEGPQPDWPGIALLAPALAHPGRHGALMLPWTAASMALSSAATQG